MELAIATQSDLAFIEAWLREEEAAYDRNCDEDPDGDYTRGFYCNLSVIKRSFDNGELEVLHVDGKAVAFHLGEFLRPGITEVHPDLRGRGLGTIITLQILQRAAERKVCSLHVSCITRRSARFWSKFGFVAQTDDSQEYYRILTYPQELPAEADRTVTVEFFSEMEWYGGKPYKTSVIPCMVQDNQILLSEICHNALKNDSKRRGDNHVRVSLDAQEIFEGWLGEDETKAFGFERNPYCYNTFAKAFFLKS